jgi:hypothetical protein
VRFEQVYWTVRPYDIAPIAEARDDESISAFLLGLSPAGNLRTTTLRGIQPRRDEQHPRKTWLTAALGVKKVKAGAMTARRFLSPSASGLP